MVPMSLWLVENSHRGKMADVKVINCKFIYEKILLLIGLIVYLKILDCKFKEKSI